MRGGRCLLCSCCCCYCNVVVVVHSQESAEIDAPDHLYTSTGCPMENRRSGIAL